MIYFICPPEHFGALGALYAKATGSSADATAIMLAARNIDAIVSRYPESKDGRRPGPAMKDKEILRWAAGWARHYQHRAGLPDFGRDDIYALVDCYLEQVKESPDWHGSKEQEICRTIYVSADSFPRRPFPRVKWIWEEKSQDPDVILEEPAPERFWVCFEYGSVFPDSGEKK